VRWQCQDPNLPHKNTCTTSSSHQPNWYFQAYLSSKGSWSMKEYGEAGRDKGAPEAETMDRRTLEPKVLLENISQTLR